MEHTLAHAALQAATQMAAAGQYHAASALLDTLEAPVRPLEALLLQAKILAQQGRYAEAIAPWQEVLAIAPETIVQPDKGCIWHSACRQQKARVFSGAPIFTMASARWRCSSFFCRLPMWWAAMLAIEINNTAMQPSAVSIPHSLQYTGGPAESFPSKSAAYYVGHRPTHPTTRDPTCPDAGPIRHNRTSACRRAAGHHPDTYANQHSSQDSATACRYPQQRP